MINELRALKRIKRNLKNILQAAPVLKNANGAGRIFELYVMMRVAKELRHSGWTVEPLASNGKHLLPPSTGMPKIKSQPFIQRGGAPTGIVPTSGNNGPSTIKISRKGRSYEILNGVLFQGRSSALHELDISVVPHQLAVQLRARAVEGFPFGRPRIAIECKDVSSKGTPDEMRSLIARMYDITILQSHLNSLGLPDGYIFDNPIPNFHDPNAPISYRDSNQKSLCVLARRGGLSSGSSKMTGLYNIRPYIDVIHPSTSAGNLVNDVVIWINTNL
jgi:hypothetical protein